MDSLCEPVSACEVRVNDCSTGRDASKSELQQDWVRLVGLVSGGARKGKQKLKWGK